MSKFVLVRWHNTQFEWVADGSRHSASCRANVYDAMCSSGFVMTKAPFIWKKA